MLQWIASHLGLFDHTNQTGWVIKKLRWEWVEERVGRVRGKMKLCVCVCVFASANCLMSDSLR